MTGQREVWEVTRFAGARRGFVPQCDCYRTADPPVLHVIVELPGVDPDELRVEADEQSLVVSGRRERPHPAGARWHQVEIEYGSFERRLTLAEDVDADAVTTAYEDGMLRIELPLVEEP